ncbi:MAG: aminotransferase class I/II-fold pyridoxal phosphate-dependent enzyme [Balneolaceae bacterium]
MNSFEPYLEILSTSLRNLDSWRRSFGEMDSENNLSPNQFKEIEQILHRLEERLEGNYPFHHPQYAGQMLKPPHPIAWLAYSLAMSINPNNHALDGGPPTSAMEKESISALAEMMGYGSGYLGHLTSAGTIANLEALFVARELHPDQAIAATSNAHYTHKRMCGVLNCDFIEIPCTADGIPDFDFIAEHASQIGTLVVTMGTTGLGTVEPLSKLNQLAKKVGFRIHADAAYGGFFKIIGDKLSSKVDWDSLHECDSIVIDPHKHGLQPYGCGCVLYKDPDVGTFFKHDSPYTYFTSDELHLGEISLECSRAGASAAALWATLQLLPLTEDGLGSILHRCKTAAEEFSGLINNHPDWSIYLPPQLDIVGYFKIPATKNISELNLINKEIFQKGMSDKKNGFHLSLFSIPADQFIKKFPDFNPDMPTATILRSVFLKPEHKNFVTELVDRLFSA